MAVQFIALAQASDILGITDRMCQTSRRIYGDIRAIQPFIKEDTPFYNEISKVISYLKTRPLCLE